MNRSIRAAFLLCCSCGGAPFTMLQASPEAESGTAMVGSDSNSASSNDAGPSSDNASETKMDSSSEAESETPDSSSNTLETSATTCTLAAPYDCGASKKAKPPFTYCMLYSQSGIEGLGMAVSPCNTCETFTCACIVAAAGCRNPTCSESGGQVRLTCDE